MKKLQKLLNKHGASLVEDGIVGPRTRGALESYIRRHFDLANLDNLIVGLRTDSELTNTFDDYLYINSGFFAKIARCSTTAGRFYVKNPLNVKGTAVLKAGFYKKSHKFITNRDWKKLWLNAPYFQQIRPVTVYRDNNKDNKLDKTMEETGLYGINIHRGGLGSLIDRWSAGCIVIPDSEWFKVVSDFYSGDVISLGLIEL